MWCLLNDYYFLLYNQNLWVTLHCNTTKKHLYLDFIITYNILLNNFDSNYDVTKQLWSFQYFDTCYLRILSSTVKVKAFIFMLSVISWLSGWMIWKILFYVLHCDISWLLRASSTKQYSWNSLKLDFYVYSLNIRCT